MDEFSECEQAVKANPEFQATLRKRGIINFDLLMVDAWSAGNYHGTEEEKTQRLSRALSWIRSDPNDNGYAHPIEGLIAVVDLNMTGIMNTGALPPGEKLKYGQLVAPQLYAPIHQHFFNVRLDMMVDGLNNSVYEVYTEAEPLGPENPHANAYFAKSMPLSNESEAQQVIDPLSGRYWKVINPAVLNGVGKLSYQYRNFST